jgi:hypothetical protein
MTQRRRKKANQLAVLKVNHIAVRGASKSTWNIRYITSAETELVLTQIGDDIVKAKT